MLPGQSVAAASASASSAEATRGSGLGNSEGPWSAHPLGRRLHPPHLALAGLTEAGSRETRA